MDFEVGKKYVARNGEIMICVAVLSKEYRGDNPFGFIREKQPDFCRSYSISGTYDYCPAYDIVSEYTAKPTVNWPAMPAWALYVAMDVWGIWQWFPTKPDKNTKGGHYFCISGYGVIPKEYAPEFSGVWQDSLIERPKKAGE